MRRLEASETRQSQTGGRLSSQFFRFGEWLVIGGGVADLSRIPQIDVQHGENVRLVVFRTRIVDLAVAICAGARAQSERASQEQQSRPKTSARSAHCCL